MNHNTALSYITSRTPLQVHFVMYDSAVSYIPHFLQTPL